jgi:hypothetical protein
MYPRVRGGHFCRGRRGNIVFGPIYSRTLRCAVTTKLIFVSLVVLVLVVCLTSL